jgi:adenylate cyclase
MESGRETTVLFATVVGAAQVLAKAGDKALRDAMERCRHRLGRAAASCGGRLASAKGDKAMVLVATPDMAADAACLMHQQMEKIPAVADIRLGAAIGFHFGPVIQKGGEVFGDTVQIAAGVCEHAGKGQIICTDGTARMLSPIYRAWIRHLATAPIKGRSDEVALCELVWQAEDPTVAPRFRREDTSLPAVLRLKYRGQRIELRRERELFTIGRDAGCGLVVNHDDASREHCTLERRRDKFVIADVSTNGTYVTIEGDKEMTLEREELTLRKRGWIAIGAPRESAKEVVEFFCGPAPVKPPPPE